MKKKLIWIGIFIILWCIVLMIDTRTQPEQNTQEQHNFQVGEHLLNEEELQREADSVDDYMRYWYEVLDTNSDGEIDEIWN